MRILDSSRYEWHITPLVRGEIIRRDTRNVIDGAMTSGRLKVAEIDTTDSAQLDVWAEWEQVVDIGEAEAIALARTRGWLVGLEDRQAQRALDRRIGTGRWINATNLLLDAVTDAVMSLPEANAVFITLDSYPGYKRRDVEKLGDL